MSNIETKIFPTSTLVNSWEVTDWDIPIFLSVCFHPALLHPQQRAGIVSSHCILHNTYLTLPTEPCTLNTAHWTLYTTYWTLHTTYNTITHPGRVVWEWQTNKHIDRQNNLVSTYGLLHYSWLVSVHGTLHWKATKKSRARVTIGGQCVLLQISLRIKIFPFFK